MSRPIIRYAVLPPTEGAARPEHISTYLRARRAAELVSVPPVKVPARIRSTRELISVEVAGNETGTGACIHGLTVPECVICIGMKPRVPKPVFTERPQAVATKTVNLGAMVSRICPACGIHEFADNDKGRVRCPQCHTNFVIIVDDITGETTIKTIQDIVLPEANPRKRRDTTSVQQKWTIPTAIGLLTICGGCLQMASIKMDLPDSPLDLLFAEPEHECTLIGFQRTSVCKHCGDAYVEFEECPKRLDHGNHERKWLSQSVKVPACKECAALTEPIEVEFRELVKGPDGRMVRLANAMQLWQATLTLRGLL